MSTLPAWLIAKNAAKPTRAAAVFVPLATPTMVHSSRTAMVHMPEIEQHEYDDAPMWCDDIGDDFAPEQGMFCTM